ncbi:MAG: GNAT family N-acetyltransferase [Myxococcota bacterium]
MHDVYSATAADTAVVGSILGESFRDDPVLVHIAGKDGLADVLYPQAYRLVYAALGHTYLIRDDAGHPAGCSMWVGPGQSTDDLSLGTILQLTWTVLRSHGPATLYRLLKLGQVTSPKHPKERHYYLNAIGILRAGQGQGLGGQLMEHVLRMADQEGVPTYLENSREQNLAFYRRYNFEVTEQLTPLPGGPPLWLMRREPRE